MRSLFLAFSLLTLSPPALSQVILIDRTHGQPIDFAGEARFEAARAALTAAGFTLETLGGGPGDLTPSALSGVDVYYTTAIAANYTPAEITALQDFVESGGGLVSSHGSGFSSDAFVDSMNELLTPYGVTLGLMSAFGSGQIISGFETHPITDSVMSIGVDFVRLIESIASPAIDLTTGPDDILAVADSGLGRVVVFTDESCFSTGGATDFELDDLDNEALLLGIFQYAASGRGGVGPFFTRGDANDDGTFDISDPVRALESLFVFGALPLACVSSADANDDGTLDISDVVTMLASLFVPDSPPVPDPYPDCGADPTHDALTCDATSFCP